MYAKKSLGQHFLHDQSALEAIRDALDPSPFDIVLEIGPGRGALTENLRIFVGKLVAVEKDDELYRHLEEKYSKEIGAGRIDLIHGDILDFDPEILRFYKDFTYALVGNIPYNITGAILKKFLSASYQPERAVFLVQKEVAERIVAKDKKESILSISVKVYGKPKIIKTVKAGSFSPAPKVDSAILLIENISKDFFKDFSEEDFFKMLRAGFKSKRKKLLSNLFTSPPTPSPSSRRGGDPAKRDGGEVVWKEKVKEAFQKLNLDENTRAEDVALNIWKSLAENLF